MEILGLNPIEMLNHWNDEIAGWAGKMGMGKQQMVLYIVAAVLAVVIGLAAIKLNAGINIALFACIGYFSGYELFMWLRQIRLRPFSRMPGWVGYILGALIAVLFILVVIKSMMNKSMFSFDVLFFMAGFYLTYCLTDNFSAPLKLIVPFAAGVVLVLLCESFDALFGLVYMAMTAAVGGFATISFLGAALPKVSVLQLGTAKAALWIAVAAAVVYFIIQLVLLLTTSDKKMKKTA